MNLEEEVVVVPRGIRGITDTFEKKMETGALKYNESGVQSTLRNKHIANICPKVNL